MHADFLIKLSLIGEKPDVPLRYSPGIWIFRNKRVKCSRNFTKSSQLQLHISLTLNSATLHSAWELKNAYYSICIIVFNTEILVAPFIISSIHNVIQIVKYL